MNLNKSYPDMILEGFINRTNLQASAEKSNSGNKDIFKTAFLFKLSRPLTVNHFEDEMNTYLKYLKLDDTFKLTFSRHGKFFKPIIITATDKNTMIKISFAYATENNNEIEITSIKLDSVDSIVSTIKIDYPYINYKKIYIDNKNSASLENLFIFLYKLKNTDTLSFLISIFNFSRRILNFQNIDEEKEIYNKNKKYIDIIFKIFPDLAKTDNIAQLLYAFSRILIYYIIIKYIPCFNSSDNIFTDTYLKNSKYKTDNLHIKKLYKLCDKYMQNTDFNETVLSKIPDRRISNPDFWKND